MIRNPVSPGAESVVSDHAPLTVDETLLQAVRQVRAGNRAEENFRAIDARLRPRLLNYFRANFFSSEDTEDLVQKTLARVYLSIQQLEHEEKFIGWLFAIARNVRRTAVEQQQRESGLMAGGMELVESLPDPR